MKLATQPITITLGAERHTLPAAEAFLPMLADSARMVGSSREAYMAAAARLGSLLWQLRRQAPYATWKNLIARAGIDEKHAQRVMRVAVRLAPTGEIDMGLVAQMREVARANGCTLPFVQDDKALASWNQADRLVREAEKAIRPRSTGGHTNQDPDARGQHCRVDGNGLGSAGRAGTGVPPVPGVPQRPRTTMEMTQADRDAEAAAALAGWDEEEREETQRRRDEVGEAPEALPSAASLRLCVSSSLPLVGPQLGLSDLYERAKAMRARVDEAFETATRDPARLAALVAWCESMPG